MREQDDPVVADELVEVDGALGGLGLEVGGLAAQAERLWSVAHCAFCAHVSSGPSALRKHAGWRGRSQAANIPGCMV